MKIRCKIVIFSIAIFTLLFSNCSTNNDIVETRFIASERPCVKLYSIDNETDSIFISDSIFRGTKIKAIVNDTVESDGTAFMAISYNKNRLYINRCNLTSDSSAVVLEKTLFVRTPVSVISDTTTSKICGQAGKGMRVEVIGYDRLNADGTVHRYKIKTKYVTGYIYGKYLVLNEKDAKKRYMPEKYDTIHSKAKNLFGAGNPLGCDFFPHEKPNFENNPMPKACYSLYMNISPSNLAKIDKYIALAKRTKINTFVIDIKDNESPGFRSDAMEEYSPTNYNHASKKAQKLYSYAVDRLHEEGFYVVARITCFKDTYFVRDNPKCAITEKATGEPIMHNKSYWPSAYNRRVWEFNVALAKEVIHKFGFDEINFDYVRFPDRMTNIEDKVDYHNKYNETKVQAIQRFVQYAVDEIHELGAYVSIDVFGECANGGYTTAYGQYWPALSNIADVMCGMPYPDHFPDGFYGIQQPWNHPYELMYQWGLRVQARQKATPSPAKVRTWVQAYHVMRHVDPNGIDYNAENIEKEIRGLYAAGLKDGYTTWLSSSNLEKYTEKSVAFCIDYLEESNLGK